MSQYSPPWSYSTTSNGPSTTESSSDQFQDLNSFRLSKRFSDHSRPINSMDIRQQGDWIATTGLDENIHLYDAVNGQHVHRIPSKKYGVDHFRFLSKADDQGVHASLNGWDHTIRLLSLEKKSYVRYFKGHRAPVTGIELSPTSATKDVFVSTSQDHTIRLWDFRTTPTQACIYEEEARVAFDPAGAILAAATSNGVISLYDVRALDAPPFKKWQLGGLPVDPPIWASVSFSPNGDYLLLSTHSNSIYLISAWDGTRIMEWRARTNDNLPITASFSPDGSSVITGSSDGNIYIFDIEKGESRGFMAADSEPVVLSLFHPSLPLIVTAGRQLNFWTPSAPKPTSSEYMDLS